MYNLIRTLRTRKAPSSGVFTAIGAGIAIITLSLFIIGCPEDTSAPTPSTPPTPPADPANLAVVFGDAHAVLTWDAVSAADEYYIYRADTPDGALTRIAEDVTITEPTYTDIGLTNGTTYRYVVRAVNSIGTSGDSSEVSDAPADAHGNTIDTATTLTSGTPVTGALACATSDVDYLAIPVTIGASLRPMGIVITVDGAQGGNFLELLDSDDMAVYFDNLSAKAYPSQTITDTGTYYIRLSCSGASTDIDLYTITVTTRVLPDDYGNTSADATPVTSGTPITGNLYRDDIDYFSITVTTDTVVSNTITISATTTGAVNTIGRIFDSNGMQLAEHNDIGGNPYNINFLVTYNATANGTYYIEVTSQFTPDLTAHAGNYSLTVTALEAPLPDAPTDLTATADDAQVSLSWTAVPDVDEYRVYRAATPNGDLMRIASNTTITQPTYTDTGLTNGTAYRYVVRAVDSIGESANSNVVSSTPAVPPPDAPTDLTATSGNAQISLSWTAVTDATSYRVYRATTPDGALVRITTTNPITTTTYVDSGLTNGTVYRYIVRAVNSVGESADSDEVSSTPLVPPATPTGLTVSGGDSHAVLSWTAAAGAAEYRVYRAATSTGDLSRIAADTTITETTFTDTGLTNGTAYRYVVRSANMFEESSNSNEVNVTPADAHGNTRAAASALTAGTAVTGALSCDSDVDYFSIPITIASSSRPMEVVITTISTESSLRLAFQDSSGTNLHTSSFFTETHPPQGADTTGTYYIRISCSSGTGGVRLYSLTVTTREVADAHSNTRTGATAVTSGTAVTGNIYSGDTDYFSIAITGATAASPVTITATTTGVVDTEGRILDSTGTELAKNNDIGFVGPVYENNFQATYNASTNGTYYIEVKGHFDAGQTEHVGDYSLTVTTSQ